MSRTPKDKMKSFIIAFQNNCTRNQYVKAKHGVKQNVVLVEKKKSNVKSHHIKRYS